MHSALARVDQGSADALWNAMHTLSFRMTQQRQEMMQLATKQQVRCRCGLVSCGFGSAAADCRLGQAGPGQHALPVAIHVAYTHTAHLADVATCVRIPTQHTWLMWQPVCLEPSSQAVHLAQETISKLESEVASLSDQLASPPAAQQPEHEASGSAAASHPAGGYGSRQMVSAACRVLLCIRECAWEWSIRRQSRSQAFQC